MAKIKPSGLTFEDDDADEYRFEFDVEGGYWAIEGPTDTLLIRNLTMFAKACVAAVKANKKGTK